MNSQTTSRGHDIAADAQRLRKLHAAGDPLILANVWDPTSALVVESAGAHAIATASNALAPVNGYEDHGHLPADVAFGALRRIADAVKVPVTADLEEAYGLSPEEFVERLVATGACGANIEDTDHRANALIDAGRQAARIAAIKSAARARGVDLVINARVDVHYHKGALEDGLKRARMYLDAGADCIYPIFLFEASAIREYVALGSTNVLYAPGALALRELAGLGVARISVASFLLRLLLKRLEAAAGALLRYDDLGVGPEWHSGLLQMKLGS
jgi:2-methylisocitrate lyase-like PEP mutase family enzyme